MKVIFVLPYSSLETRDFKLDLFNDGYHVRIAKEIAKMSQKYQLECWRPERKARREMAGEKDGITYKVFPSWRPSLGFLNGFVYKRVVDLYAPLRGSLWKEYSLSLVRALKRECMRGEVLLYLMHIPFDLTYMIMLSCGNVPIIAQHIGNTPYGYNWFSYLTNLPFSIFEQRALSNVDAILVGTEWHYRGFEKSYKKAGDIVYPMPQCVDFDRFKPMDKAEARRAVGIGEGKKVVIHVGRFDYAKGFDTILEILPKLRKDYDVELVAIGGTKMDMLYQKAVESGVRIFEWMPQEELVKYYNASDVYLYPKFYEKEKEADAERYGGAGVASVEAMACGVPVIGTNLKGFFATREEMRGIGGIPKDKEDLLNWVSDVFNNPECYERCREVAMKYYSWQPIIERLLDLFGELEEKYYGTKS